MTTIESAGSTKPIATPELLAAIDTLKADWPARFPEHSVLSLAAALAREMSEGTVSNTGSLTDAGREILRAGGTSNLDTVTMQTLNSPPEQFR